MRAALVIGVAGVAVSRLLGAEGPVFNRDVRPILSDKCFRCHGPDAGARKADLRLDVRDNAIADHDGVRAIVPGKPDESELIQRIETSDSDDVMPPPKSHLALSAAEKTVLRRWIQSGAEYQLHWSFVPPKAAPLPGVKLSDWAQSGIDRFVLARLEREGLEPAQEAAKATLLRRLSLTLTGLPPTLEELDAFLTDASPAAYERAVDRMLASPHFGERMAVDWLDAARYADTNGYFSDHYRQAWPWRDWVINAFNRNLPYDRFTIEQLAGDLLPDATTEQKIATGFNRNHMVTNESGVIDEEYRVEYVADRLETTATVWMGLTLGCARCHDHKYDPLSQREYYQLFAFFNNGPEKGLVTQDNPPPVLDVPSEHERTQLERLHASRVASQSQFEKFLPTLQKKIADWETRAGLELQAPADALTARFSFEPNSTESGIVEKGNLNREAGIIGQAGAFDAMEHVELPSTLALEATKPWTLGIWMKPTGSLNCVLSKIEPTGMRRGIEVLWQKGRVQVNLVNRWGVSAIEAQLRQPMRGGDWHQVIISYAGKGKASGLHVYVDGIDAPLNIVRDSLRGSITNSEPLRVGRRDNGLGFYGKLDELRVLTRAVDANEARAWFWSDRLTGILPVAGDKRDKVQKQFLVDYFVERHASQEIRKAHSAAASSREAEETFRAQLPKTLVMQESSEPRKTHLLKRGQYSQPGEEVHADVPSSLPALADAAPRDRLALARWLVSRDHPLTARVEVNRLWQQCFGEGLVRTVNDFGSQGESPTHPELLDWLAVRFIESGWDIKAMLKLIVMSATYRQSSVPSPALVQSDPENRLLARGPRFRMPAEMIRDHALAASGLLVRRIGGPSVKPYQPAGLWEAVSYDSELSYEQDKGDGLWRRSLYTFWKRQAPPPALLAFDAPTRETCVVRRARTNTPLQALALLNEDIYVEAARALAAFALARSGTDEARLDFAFRRVLTRAPADEELSILLRLLAQQRTRFAENREGAKQLLSVGASPLPREFAPPELAAWTVTMHSLLNLDETITSR